MFSLNFRNKSLITVIILVIIILILKSEIVKSYLSSLSVKGLDSIGDVIAKTTGISEITDNFSTIINIKQDKIKRNVSESLKKMVASDQKWKCNICLKELDFTYEIDHILPLYKGGTNNRDNLQALCRPCHGKKTLTEKMI